MRRKEGDPKFLFFKHAMGRNLIFAISRGLAHAGMNGSSISPVYDKKLMKMIKTKKKKAWPVGGHRARNSQKPNKIPCASQSKINEVSISCAAPGNGCLVSLSMLPAPQTPVKKDSVRPGQTSSPICISSKSPLSTPLNLA